MKKTIVISAVAVVLIGVGSFFAGMQYQKTQQTQLGQMILRGGEGQGIRRADNGSRPVIGEIISQDDKSITVKMQDDSSKIVILSDTTSINKQASGSAEDLKPGERVVVIGKENSDGSVTAQTISLGGNMVRVFGEGTQTTE